MKLIKNLLLFITIFTIYFISAKNIDLQQPIQSSRRYLPASQSHIQQKLRNTGIVPPQKTLPIIQRSTPITYKQLRDMILAMQQKEVFDLVKYEFQETFIEKILKIIDQNNLGKDALEYVLYLAMAKFGPFVGDDQANLTLYQKQIRPQINDLLINF